MPLEASLDPDAKEGSGPPSFFHAGRSSGGHAQICPYRQVHGPGELYDFVPARFHPLSELPFESVHNRLYISVLRSLTRRACRVGPVLVRAVAAGAPPQPKC